MKGVIWAPNDSLYLLEAKQELDFIKHQYLNKNINIIKEQENFFQVDNENFFQADNGDTWEIVKAYMDVKGIKCNISYIHRSIGGDFIDEVIRPSTLSYPWQGFNYYGTPSFYYYKDQEEDGKLEQELDELKCPNCGKRFKVFYNEHTLAPSRLAPWCLSCSGDCHINIAAESEADCIRLLKDYWGIKDLSIEHYHNQIQRLYIDNKNIINLNAFSF